MKIIPSFSAVIICAALFALGHPSLSRAQATVAARDGIDLHKQKTLYLVGYAHLDTQWRWNYPQSIGEYLGNTLHQNFTLIDKYPDYIFNFSGSRRYQMMREYHPEDWDRLKAYIKAGRWFPCGSSVDEGDANVPSLESMVRHVLYGNHYFRKEFGVASNEFMLPDCFGFPASLPTILSHCGLKGFSTQKLTWGSAVGIPFKIGNWIGPDGSAIAAALDPGAYVGVLNEDLSQNPTWLTRIDTTGALSGVFADYHYYGTGDRGGGPADSSVNWMEKSLAGKGPLHVVSSKADQLFLDLPADSMGKLPRYKGDLLLVPHSTGSLSSEAYMKRWTRKNELLANAAERSSVVAAWLGGTPYPSVKLLEAWNLVLGSEMHDMLPGTCLPKSYEYCWNDELLAANQFAAVQTDAAGGVIAALDTRTKGIPMVVYNPLSAARQDIVEGSIPCDEAMKAVRVVGPDGKELSAQVTHREQGRINFIFAPNVKALSYTVFQVFPKMGDLVTDAPSPLHVTNRTLESDHYKVTLNNSGDVSSIFDKQARREVLAAPVRMEFHYENPSQYPAWNMDWADRQKPARGYVDGPASIRIVENGPVRVTLEIERKAEGSRFVSRVSLAAGGAGDAVEFHDKIDWGTRQASLKTAFPLTVSNPLAAYDDKVGVTMRDNNRPDKYEVPQQEWLDLTDTNGAYGVSLLNDSKYGSDKPDDHTVRLTLLYTPGVRAGFEDQGSQDFGRHDIAYALAGHAGDWRQGGSVARGRRFNQPLRAFTADSHPGQLGRAFSFAAMDNPCVEITALKKAEDSNETIVRLRETGGQGPQSVHLKLAPYILAAREVDGQERPLGNAAIKPRGGELAVTMKPYGLRTFALKLASPAVPENLPATEPLSLPYNEDVISSRANHANGSFDDAGRTYPAEMLPATIVSEAIPFRMAPTADGQNNAVACNGQTIKLPQGGYDHILLLASAADGDRDVTFHIAPDGSDLQCNVEDWSGYIGQWDNRLWKGMVPQLSYNWSNALDGLVPGFVKPATVAWFSSHLHERGGDGVYDYCYLYKYDLPLPRGAQYLTLPNDPHVHVFAATLTGHGRDAVQPMEPLFDTLADHQPDAPVIAKPVQGKADDVVFAGIADSFYCQDGGIRYTMDGSDPGLSSPQYTSPIALHSSATLKARMFLPGVPGGGPIATERYEIDDHTPPSLGSAIANSFFPQVRATFSEPVERTSAETAANYSLEPAGPKVRSAKLSADGMSVVLSTDAIIGTSQSLVIRGIRDQSPAANTTMRAQCPVTVLQPVYNMPDVKVCDGKQSYQLAVPGLPVGAGDSWSMNFFVRIDHQPENRTLIAGFGSTEAATGKGRYLSKFANGIHYWSGNQDGETSTALDPARWQMLSATYDGTTLRIYKDAVQIGQATVTFAPEQSIVQIAPLEPWDKLRRFQGEICQFTIWKTVFSPADLAGLLANGPIK